MSHKASVTEYGGLPPLFVLQATKAGHGGLGTRLYILDGFITWCVPLLTLCTVASHDWSSSNRTHRTNWTERTNGIQGKEEWRGENKPRREQTEHDVSSGTHHMINPSRPSPRFSYCKRQKLGVEAWEQGYASIDVSSKVSLSLTVPKIWARVWYILLRDACLSRCRGCHWSESHLQ